MDEWFFIICGGGRPSSQVGKKLCPLTGQWVFTTTSLWDPRLEVFGKSSFSGLAPSRSFP
ncbi:UNVERIFIED_CONTAM: hypothetical protein Slati_4299200 [Sesamum latifolium]|uniref:Uncharacterized protein n=1 Tax=Sesamum latifolium TaxID=2727402 RepID=A0AAW2TEV8_9LAMI